MGYCLDPSEETSSPLHHGFSVCWGHPLDYTPILISGFFQKFGYVLFCLFIFFNFMEQILPCSY
uniref:Uncharacterized protein n=1 Tax=Engystomops pustulosus TaxID=76066 RepID=A0AAV6Z2A8_ENGPU|nr:hypothetical protein GDO81_025347 [Engystomops pustulosus]